VNPLPSEIFRAGMAQAREKEREREREESNRNSLGRRENTVYKGLSTFCMCENQLKVSCLSEPSSQIFSADGFTT